MPIILHQKICFCFLITFLLTGIMVQEAASWPSVPQHLEPLPELEDISGWRVVPAPRRLIANVSPSIESIVADVTRSNPVVILSSKQEVATALERVADGKKGPLLFISNGTKMRIMELRSKEVQADLTDTGKL
ncbi:MAG: hypothetical protein V2A70_05210 [Candidatus Omnitrophota bacterium]